MDQTTSNIIGVACNPKPTDNIQADTIKISMNELTCE